MSGVYEIHPPARITRDEIWRELVLPGAKVVFTPPLEVHKGDTVRVALTRDGVVLAVKLERS